MNLFDRNYKAVVDRGLITDKTLNSEFYFKLLEELNEVEKELIDSKAYNINEEIADCIVVCTNWLIHRGVNIDELLAYIAEKNEARAKNNLTKSQ